MDKILEQVIEYFAIITSDNKVYTNTGQLGNLNDVKSDLEKILNKGINKEYIDQIGKDKNGTNNIN